MSNGPDRELAVRSVERAIAILDLLSDGGERSGADLSRELGVHRSTALRLLGTLARHALVERDEKSGRYRLGRRLQQLASVVTGEFDLRSEARPVCDRLSRAVGETVTLDVLAGDMIVPIEQATESTSVVSVNWLGRRTPVHCTASGKAILAYSPPSVRDRILGRRLEASTPHTITDRKEIEAQLDAVRIAGVAVTYEELELGLDAVAAPVFGPAGEVVAALDVSGPSLRLRADGQTELVHLVREGAADLSHRLGFRAGGVKADRHSALTGA